MSNFNQTQAGGTATTAYVVVPPPADPNALGLWLYGELQKVQRAITSAQLLTPQAAIKAPQPPIENMIRFAKAPWRPVVGQAADKWVTYVNGAWVYLPNA